MIESILRALRNFGFGGFAPSEEDDRILEILANIPPGSFTVTEGGLLYRTDNHKTEVNEFHVSLACMLPRRALNDLQELAREKNTTEMNRLLTLIAKEKEVRNLLRDGGQFYIKGRDGDMRPINLDF